MNLRHINPILLGELQVQLIELDVDLGDIEIRDWSEFPHEGVQVYVRGTLCTPCWLIDTDCEGGAVLLNDETCYGYFNVALRVASEIAAHMKEEYGDE